MGSSRTTLSQSRNTTILQASDSRFDVGSVVDVVRYLATIATAAVGLALAGAAPATSLLPAQKGALEAVRLAVAAGRIDRSAAAIDRAEIGRAAQLIRRLPAGRGNHLSVALAEIASLSGGLRPARSRWVWSAQLWATEAIFEPQLGQPADAKDIAGSSSVMLPVLPRPLLLVPPTGNFGALNADVARGDVVATQLLADALVARGVYQPGGGIGWDSYFASRARPRAGLAVRDGAGRGGPGARAGPPRWSRTKTLLDPPGQGRMRTGSRGGLRRAVAGRSLNFGWRWSRRRASTRRLQAVGVAGGLRRRGREHQRVRPRPTRMLRAAAATFARFNTGSSTCSGLRVTPRRSTTSDMSCSF